MTKFLINKNKQCKMKIKIKLLIFALISTKLIALEKQLITRIQVPISDYDDNSLTITSVRNDGAFVAMLYANRLPKLGLAVKANGENVLFAPLVNNSFNYTNIISSQVESGVATIIQEEMNENNVCQNDGTLIIKTFRQSGYLSCDNYVVSKNGYRVKFSNNNKQYISEIHTNIYYSVISKFDTKGKLLSQITINEKSSLANRFNESDFISYVGTAVKFGLDNNPNQNQIIFGEVNERVINLYRLTDSDLLSSPNRITFGSSQNGSLTATVNNPEQALLNVQSSTNLIDWNTFKTIQNEPSFEIVVPANKPKEFIRVIE